MIFSLPPERIVYDSNAQRHDQQLDRGKGFPVTTPTEVFEAALAWYQAGFCVIPPVATGRKAPLGEWKDYQTERPHFTVMRNWYDAQTQYGVGLLCGQVSGNLEMLELEGAVQNNADFIVLIETAMATAGLDEIWDRLHDKYHEFTPAGGLHLLYRISDHPVPGNTKIAERPKPVEDHTDKDRATMAKTPDAVIMQTLIETRGEGGYVIVAPSQGPVHPSGNPWVLGYGCEAGRVPTITWAQREALVAVLAAFDVPRPRRGKPAVPAIPTQRTASTVTPGAEGLRVGDDFNQRGDWGFLETHGWEISHAAGAETFWVRPGKDRRDGHSASTGYAGDADRLYVWSSATPFPTEEPISRFAAYATLEHGGDWKAATKDLAAQGYGEQRVRIPAQRTQQFGSLTWDGAAAMATQVVEDAEARRAAVDQPPAVPATRARVYLPAPGRESHTDMGTANRFLREHPHAFLYVSDEAEWRWYDGVIWQVDRAMVRINQAVELMLDRMADECQVLLKDPEPEKADIGKSMAKYIRVARNNSGRKGLLATLAVKAAVTRRDLDPHLHLLGLRNGVLDTRTGDVVMSHPSYLITRQMAVAYDPAALAPGTREYMTTMLPEPGLREFTQRAVGYTMTGEQDQRAFIIAHGPRGSGKSQFVELWGKMFGDYATVAADAAFRKRERNASGASAELHALQGFRFVWASESDEDVVFDADIVKRICGGETMATRTLYGKPENWRPECVVWLATNNFPRFPADEEAVWDRVKPIGFEANFDRDGSGLQRILSISDKLFQAEASGILNLMIEWLRTYRDLGWIEPDTLLGAIDTKKTEGDPVAQFWVGHIESGEIVADPDSEINFATLYQDYKNWTEETLGQKPRGSRRFGAALRVIVKYDKLVKRNGKTFLPGWQKKNLNGVLGTMGALG